MKGADCRGGGKSLSAVAEMKAKGTRSSISFSAMGKVTPFVTGFLDKAKNEFWGRPVDVLQLPDGSVLIADEQVGAIYRVSYKK